MTCSFVSAYKYTLEDQSKIDLYHYRTVCHYYREVVHSNHLPSWQF